MSQTVILLKERSEIILPHIRIATASYETGHRIMDVREAEEGYKPSRFVFLNDFETPVPILYIKNSWGLMEVRAPFKNLEQELGYQFRHLQTENTLNPKGFPSLPLQGIAVPYFYCNLWLEGPVVHQYQDDSGFKVEVSEYANTAYLLHSEGYRISKEQRVYYEDGSASPSYRVLQYTRDGEEQKAKNAKTSTIFVNPDLLEIL